MATTAVAPAPAPAIHDAQLAEGTHHINNAFAVFPGGVPPNGVAPAAEVNPLNPDPPVIRAHNFVPKTYGSPHWCEYCSDFLWGISKQGWRCTACAMDCHARCRKIALNANHPCPGTRPATKKSKENAAAMAAAAHGGKIPPSGAKDKHKNQGMVDGMGKSAKKKKGFAAGMAKKMNKMNKNFEKSTGINLKGELKDGLIGMAAEQIGVDEGVLGKGVDAVGAAGKGRKGLGKFVKGEMKEDGGEGIKDLAGGLVESFMG